MVTRLQAESREQAIARLAQRAREAGMQILRDERGRYWATSISHPGTTHAVCGVACDCKAFTHRAMCSHFALLLVHLGWIGDEDPTPEPTFKNVKVDAHFADAISGVEISTPEQPTTCRFCHGQGSESATELFDGRRLDIRIPCWHCRGSGEQTAA